MMEAGTTEFSQKRRPQRTVPIVRRLQGVSQPQVAIKSKLRITAVDKKNNVTIGVSKLAGHKLE